MVNQNTLSVAANLEELAFSKEWFLKNRHRDIAIEASHVIQSMYIHLSKMNHQVSNITKSRDDFANQLNETRNRLSEIEFRMRKEERLENELKVCQQAVKDKENSLNASIKEMFSWKSKYLTQQLSYAEAKQDADEEYAAHSETLKALENMQHKYNEVWTELQSAKHGWVGEASKQEEGRKELEQVSGMLVTLQAKHDEMIEQLQNLMERYRP